MQVFFATSNQHKIQEANEIGKDHDIEFLKVDQPYPEIRDEKVSKIALEGVRYVYQKIGKPVIVEDSGLFIESLNGFPGTYSSIVFKKIGNDGILRLMDGITDRKATFISAIGYYDGVKPEVFEGEIEGIITQDLQGTGGFGYDPIFKPTGSEKTFALDETYKNKVSHRRKALEKLVSYMKKD